MGDDSTSLVNLGIAFRFYDRLYEDAVVSSNGLLMFRSTYNGDSYCCSGEDMSLSNDPYRSIAFFWTDLYPPAGGTISYASTSGKRLVLRHHALETSLA